MRVFDSPSGGQTVFLVDMCVTIGRQFISEQRWQASFVIPANFTPAKLTEENYCRLHAWLQDKRNDSYHALQKCERYLKEFVGEPLK